MPKHRNHDWYDAWGNATSRTYQGTTATLSYDSLDRLVKWGTGSSTYEQYAYDAAGNRTIQRTVTSSSTTITVYAFGLEEYQYSGSGTLQTSTHYYMLGGKLVGAVTGLGTPTTVMFLTDALGNLLATLSNTAGTAAIQGNQVYGPYGNQLSSSQAQMDTTKGYAGQEGNALTGSAGWDKPQPLRPGGGRVPVGGCEREQRAGSEPLWVCRWLS